MHTPPDPLPGQPSLFDAPADGAPALVSVIVRSMDRPTLGEALASIAAQSWPAIEVVIVNAKGEGHAAPASKCGAFDVRLVATGSRLTRSQAASAGLRAARGTFACFLDDDDWFAPDHIDNLARRLEAHPELVAAYSGTSCVAADAETGVLREVMRYEFAFDPARLLCENYLPIHAVLFRTDAAARTQGFDEALAIFEDWDFWIQLSRVGPFQRVPKLSATYRLGSGDSGLYGNAALQEEYAQEVLAKWRGLLDASDWSGVWSIARSSLRASELAQHHAERLDAELKLMAAEANAQRMRAGRAEADAIAATQREAAQRARAGELDALRIEGLQAQQRLGEALRGTMKEYEHAVALLQREQHTVIRPLVRNLKRSVRPLWRKLPAPLRAAAHRALGRHHSMAVTQASPPAVIPGEGQQHDWEQVLGGGSPGAFTVIVFPVIDWHFRIQRPQHLARELGKQGHRVLYLSTTFAAGTGPTSCRYIESPAENVHLVQLAVDGPAPNLYEHSLGEAQARQLAHALAWLQQAAGLGALVSLVDLPFWAPVALRLPANTIVYDCIDYHAGFSTNTGTMLGEEEALLRDCDLLLTTSARLADLMQAKAPRKPHALVRNGTEVEHFAHVPGMLKLQRDGRPVIGYFGAISEWFDIGMVVHAARQRPQWRFVLVGSTFGCDLSQAKRLPNIELIGEVPYADLPGWVHAFDVCTIPFLLTELTLCTNPVKVYEYLSAGKPVLATRMPELEAIADQVLLASDADDFVRQLETALAQDNGPAVATARREWATAHSWQARAGQLSQAVADCLPVVSVIVLCYNNLELTKACLASVERHSHWPRLELVVVDNASSDGTPEYLRQFAQSRPWVKLVLNEKNLGFAAGNNVGLAAATGEILIMLNNDTEVTPGWIHGLRRHFERDARLGLVGPVTDNIGNEAKIDANYGEPSRMAAWAAMRAVEHAGEFLPARVVAFFCVALRRKVFEQVGGLDEAFGLGFFEDDDYCNRARAAGWDMAIADDVFVHHHLSASFDKLKSSTRQQLFDRNKALYESKWGPWVPHRYRQAKGSE